MHWIPIVQPVFSWTKQCGEFRPGWEVSPIWIIFPLQYNFPIFENPHSCPLVNKHNYGKSPFSMGKSTIMVIFNSYVKLPEGTNKKPRRMLSGISFPDRCSCVTWRWLWPSVTAVTRWTWRVKPFFQNQLKCSRTLTMKDGPFLFFSFEVFCWVHLWKNRTPYLRSVFCSHPTWQPFADEHESTQIWMIHTGWWFGTFFIFSIYWE